MACPYFLPLRRLPDAEVRGWRMPLGGTFAGECRAPGLQPAPTDEDQARSCCNTGYASGRCARFPGDAAADCVRFLIREEGEGSATVMYAFEKNHYPAGRGELKVPPKNDGVLAAQAQTYWRSYLERKWK